MRPGNYIHGVVENDSLPCLLEGDYYFFGVRNRDAVIYKNSSTQLTRISDREYMLNYEENGNYSPVKLSFINNKLSVSDFDYDPGERAFSFISAQNESNLNQQNVIVLSPSQLEFQQLNSTKYFVERTAFSRITN